MDKKASQFVFMIVIVVLFVGGLAMFMNKVNNKPGELDNFAKALTAEGAQFYGAFWCPHCQAEKALFGSSKKYLPYVECSNPDRSPTQVCTDNKIESFPTWTFKNGISLNSKSDPVVCQAVTGDTFPAGEDPICSQMSSRYFKTYKFADYQFSLRSPTDPIHKGDVWQFPAEAATSGEIPLKFLAQQIGYALP
ncbi:MAG: hypothetical protein WCK91_02555 [bacterium]